MVRRTRGCSCTLKAASEGFVVRRGLVAGALLPMFGDSVRDNRAVGVKIEVRWRSKVHYVVREVHGMFVLEPHLHLQ